MNNQKSPHRLPNIIDLTNSVETPTISPVNNNKNEADDDVILVSTTLPAPQPIKFSKSPFGKERRKPYRHPSGPYTTLTCPICLESCIKQQPTSTRCGHIFCEKCIKHFIQVDSKCPICKMKINNSDLFRIYV